MAREQFRKVRFTPDKQTLLNKIIEIVREYQAQSIRMTLRQLYYQLVSRDIIPNTVKEYGKISDLLTNARYAGLIDWNSIEDRGRVPKFPAQFEDVKDLVDSACYSYRLDRWKDQKCYVELFCEKEALASVLAPIAHKWHIHFCVNKGYASATAMHDLSVRLREPMEAKKRCIILYLGDFDPSGRDMIRDIGDRIREFLTMKDEYDKNEELIWSTEGGFADWFVEENFEVYPIALTSEQIRKYNPPPNPAKLTDPRAQEYIRQYGDKSWEVDALRPDVMIKVVEDAIQKFVDVDKMDAIKAKEQQDITSLKEFGEKLVKKQKKKE